MCLVRDIIKGSCFNNHHAESRLINLLRPRREIARELRHRPAEASGVLRRAVDGYVQDLA